VAISETLSNFRNRYSQDNPQAMRNPWIIGGLGLIGMFFAFNAVFIYFAITSNPGLVTEDYYDRGQHYEDNIQKIIAAQNALNWQTKLAVPSRIIINQPDIFCPRTISGAHRLPPTRHLGSELHSQGRRKYL